MRSPNPRSSALAISSAHAPGPSSAMGLERQGERPSHGRLSAVRRGRSSHLHDPTRMSPRPGYAHSAETRIKMRNAQSSRAVRVARSISIQAKHPERFPPNHSMVLSLSRKEDGRRLAWARALWQKYGLTVEEEARLYEIQNGRCPLCLCRLAPNTVRDGSGKDHGHWRVDHDHDTNTVRGLLCHTCNWHLGFFSNIAVIVAYLRGTSCAQT